MQKIYFVLIDKENAQSSEKARKNAYHTLIGEGFIYTLEFFTGGRCDRFNIGGGWSGFFTTLMTGKDMSKRKAKSFLGCDDDAQILSKSLLRKLKEWDKKNDIQWMKPVCYFDSDNYLERELSEMTEEHLGRWIVLVGCHL